MFDSDGSNNSDIINTNTVTNIRVRTVETLGILPTILTVLTEVNVQAVVREVTVAKVGN